MEYLRFFLKYLWSNKIDTGALLESVIESMLNNKGVKYNANCKYKIDNKNRQELGHNKEEGECDFIIESKDTILILEVKQKPLTRIAQSGDTLSILDDFYKSFIKAQIQATWHEIILKKYGVINFENFSLKLLDRKVLKVSLSLSDYMGLTDNFFIQMVMKALLGADIKPVESSSSGIAKANSMNKMSKELCRQYDFDALKEQRDSQFPFMNSKFFTLHQFLFLLNNAHSSEDLISSINALKNTTFGVRDFYQEYFYKQTLVKNAEK